MRRAYTLIEILVVLLIVGTAMGIVLDLYFQGQGQSARLDFRLTGLQAAFLLRSHLADDLSSSLPALAAAAPVPNASAITVRRVTRRENAGEAGTCLDADLRPVADTVTWEFDPGTHRVLRDGVPVSSARFLDVTFSYLPATAERGETVELHAVVVPDGALDSPTRTSFDVQELISFSFHVPQATALRAYPEYARH